uniref:Uncharacterized protein n=1 Tax=Micrurus corallinus TaxID=54390 RepID=A0A2D4GBW3_MICCO
MNKIGSLFTALKQTSSQVTCWCCHHQCLYTKPAHLHSVVFCSKTTKASILPIPRLTQIKVYSNKNNYWTEINTSIHLPSEIVDGFCYKIPTRLFHRQLWKYSVSPCFWTVIIYLLVQKFSHI